MTPTESQAASTLRVALKALEEGCTPTAAHFAREAAAQLTAIVSGRARGNVAPGLRVVGRGPEHISKPIGRVLDALRPKVEGK